MQLAIVPGLVLTLVWGILGISSRPAHALTDTSTGLPAPALFSIAAQATTTATLTTGETITATSTITSTGTITAAGALTATATITGAQPTLPPLPLEPQQPGLQANPLEAEFLNSVPPPWPYTFGPYAWAFLVLMVALLGASLYFMLVKRPEWKRTNPVLFRAVNRWGQVGLWLSGVSLLFLLFRVLPLDFFNLRFWLYLMGLAAIVAVALFAYWYRTSYPMEMAKYLKTQRARQYMPGGGGKGTARQPAGASTRLPNPPARKPQSAPASETSPRTQATQPDASTPQQRSAKRRKRR